MSDYWSLTRPRIVTLVLLAMAVSAWTTGGSAPSWPALAHALLGAAMVIAGAIALNQRLECQGDAQMPRTASRPLPAHRLGRRQVTCFGLAATALGLAYLTVMTNPTLTVLAAIGWLAYVGVYTPLKPRTSWQTPVGAAAGAMPVLLGAAVVDAAFSPWALILFGIVYFWQFPHSMAIAWRYRQEFAAAGVKVATVTDPSGRTAGLWAVLGAAALLPISLMPLFCCMPRWFPSPRCSRCCCSPAFKDTATAWPQAKSRCFAAHLFPPRREVVWKQPGANQPHLGQTKAVLVISCGELGPSSRFPSASFEREFPLRRGAAWP